MVCRLAVGRLVTHEEHLVGHAEGDAAHDADEDEDQGGPHGIPGDDEEAADDLDPKLAPVALDRAALGLEQAKALNARTGCAAR